jgi:ribosomal protein L40E
MNLLIRAKLSWQESIGMLWLTFDFFSVMDSASFLLCVFVQANGPKDLLQMRPNVPFENVNQRACSKCNAWKPPRAHHCRYCRRCILMYDHHCSWVGNCIGHGNLHFFTQYLLYTSSGAVYSLFLMAHYSGVGLSYYSEETSSDGRRSLACFIWLLYAAILFVLSGLATAYRLVKVMTNVHRGITAYEALLLAPRSRSLTTSARRLGIALGCASCLRWRRRTDKLGGNTGGDCSHGDMDSGGGGVDHHKWSEKADALGVILVAERGAEHGERRTLRLFFGRRSPLSLVLPLPGDPACELLAPIEAWEAALAARGAWCA